MLDRYISLKKTRKLKVFAVVGLVGFFITGALTIWAGVAAVSTIKVDINNLPKLHAINCWGKAQSLLAIQPWLERPAIENIVNLKVACLEDRVKICEGIDCKNSEQKLNTASEGFI